MYSPLISIGNARRSSSLISLLARTNGGELISPRSFSAVPTKYGPQENSQDGSKFSNNIALRKISNKVWGGSASSGLSSSIMNLKGNISAPYALNFVSSIHSASCKDFLNRGGSGSGMNFVRGVIEEDDNGSAGASEYSVERSVDFVHIKILRNNCFVTVTDSRGNKKFGFSNGSLPDKGGGKTSRYSSEAVSEHVGRMCRNMGLKSVVIRVNGHIHFKKKKQAIMSWREGFTNSRTDQSPVVCIEDTTRKPHNGCRRPRPRRV